MKEKLLNLKIELQKNLDRVFIIMLGVIVLILGALYWNEQSSAPVGSVAITPTQPVIVLRDDVGSQPEDEATWPFYSLKNMADPEAPFDDESNPYKILGEINMFDAKTVKSEQELADDAKKFFLEAQNFRDKKEFNKALQLLDKALLYKPDFNPARALRDQINSEMTAVTPTPTPAEGSGGDVAGFEGAAAGRN